MNEEVKDVLEATFEYVDDKFEQIHKKKIEETIREELNKKFNELYEILDLMYLNLKSKKDKK